MLGTIHSFVARKAHVLVHFVHVRYLKLEEFTRRHLFVRLLQFSLNCSLEGCLSFVIGVLDVFERPRTLNSLINRLSVEFQALN